MPLGRPCDAEGNFLPTDVPPPPRPGVFGDWSPYADEIQFRTADFLYRKVEMSGGNIDELMELWAMSAGEKGNFSPFDSFDHMYAAIDATKVGDAPWKCFSTTYTGNLGEDAPTWQLADYEVWYRDPDVVIANLLANPDFDKQFDYAPYIELDKSGQRRWSDLMSANLAWRHSDEIFQSDADTEGAMLCPIVLGADKTTVSVATGHVEYHPLYLSIGNVHNSVRRAHRNAVVPIGFLAIPKADRKYDDNPAFRTFKRQLYHSSIAAILRTLRDGMSKPVIRLCPDGHFRRVIYDLAAFIADYPEQVLLAGIVQGWCPKCTAQSSNLDGPGGMRSREYDEELMEELDSDQLWDNYGIDDDITACPFTSDFPRADIHEMLSSDLLHQLIKGVFKDHLVQWVGEYLECEHGSARAKVILDDIDRRVAATPAFPGLRRFPHGRRFKQWTGDDSKALMKVYITALVGYMPSEIIKCFSSFMDACYIARRADFDVATLDAFNVAVAKFHHHREIFRTSGVRPTGFNLPRQHALKHYRRHIEEFGAPGGLCSSITESRHITAVKKPWRCSNRFAALGQMLRTNQRLDKLASARSHFVEMGMLPPSHEPPPPPPDQNGENDDEGPVDDIVKGDVQLARTRARNYPRTITELADHIHEPTLPHLADIFLAEQLDVEEAIITSKISVFNSAVAMFYAPSDPSGIRGLRREHIRCTPSWRGRGSRRDTAFVAEDQDKPGMKGLRVVRVKLFFSFMHDGTTYPCALVEWYKTFGRRPHADTGMWEVRPEYTGAHRDMSVLHLDTFLRGAHLLPFFDSRPLPFGFDYTYTLDLFRSFFVNKYIDHHAHEIAY
ncbi:hypothetical protein FIBSPDRAFT_733491 [Athelia psychrophila]|uniref:CxC2-like cysteine cluster KDZ transposase-associated domain-containing protein n=1 Tax=Athelia psychrophila TaxID=1759441 RepID=A0A166P1U2_9AGAM|nr:hypothetical protein FIBSPDRAFT_733491 [Fibularhizoctonia sp. CBS 109695]